MTKIHRFNNQFRWYLEKAIKYSNGQPQNEANVAGNCLSNVESTIQNKAKKLLEVYDMNVRVSSSYGPMEDGGRYPLLNAGTLITRNESSEKVEGCLPDDYSRTRTSDSVIRNSYEDGTASSDCYSEKESVQESHFSYE